ncbi:MAG: DUF2219 family protein [Cellvibrionales bacterium]|nr:DUF2219 family protein [Cellvibrionales bacterium]
MRKYITSLCFALLSANLIATPNFQFKKHHIAIDSDNDSFMAMNEDKDYTFSLGVNYSHLEPLVSLQPIHTLLGVFNTFLLSDQIAPFASNYGFGLYGFTPKIKSIPNTWIAERPYASLNYFSFSNFYLSESNNRAVKSSISVGVLGLDLVRNIQNAYHEKVGFNALKGWMIQISDGGEPTAKYSLEWQHRIAGINNHLDIMQSVETSVGYITEVNHSAYLRVGIFSSPWWSYQPTTKNYGEKTLTLSPKAFDTYLSLGVVNRLRLYNSFLQGQFSEKDHAATTSEAKPYIASLWIGLTAAFKTGFRISYHANYQTSELNTGRANRAMSWGSFVFSQSF